MSRPALLVLLVAMLACSRSEDRPAQDVDGSTTTAAPLRLGVEGATVRPTALVALPDGGFVVVGSTNDDLGGAATKGVIDAMIVRLAPDGSVVWNATLGDAGLFVRAWDVALVDDSRIVIAGLVNGRGSIEGHPLVATYSGFVASYDLATGNRGFLSLVTDASGSVEPMGIEALGGGAFAIAGYTNATTLAGQPSLGQGDAFVARFDAAGALVRLRRIGTSAEEYPMAFTRHGDRLYLARKEIDLATATASAVELLALDADDSVVGSFPFAEPRTLEIAGLADHPDGICAGLQHRSYDPGSGSTIQYGVHCFSSTLDERGSVRGGSLGGRAYTAGIACADDGSCALVGSVDGRFEDEPLDESREAFVATFSPDLVEIWAARRGVATSGELFYVNGTAIAAGANGFRIAGYSSGEFLGPPIGRADGFVIGLEDLR